MAASQCAAALTLRETQVAQSRTTARQLRSWPDLRPPASMPLTLRNPTFQASDVCSSIRVLLTAKPGLNEASMDQSLTGITGWVFQFVMKQQRAQPSHCAACGLVCCRNPCCVRPCAIIWSGPRVNARLRPTGQRKTPEVNRLTAQDIYLLLHMYGHNVFTLRAWWFAV